MRQTDSNSTYVDKFLESWIGPFLLLELVFTKQLMSSVSDERLKQRYSLEEEITQRLHDGLLFLAFRELLCERVIDCKDLVDVPEYLADKVISLRWSYDV